MGGVISFQFRVFTLTLRERGIFFRVLFCEFFGSGDQAPELRWLIVVRGFVA